MQQLPLQLLALSIGDPNEFLISKNYISREFDHQMVGLKKFCYYDTRFDLTEN